jgi:hypothetical protein
MRLIGWGFVDKVSVDSFAYLFAKNVKVSYVHLPPLTKLVLEMYLHCKI